MKTANRREFLKTAGGVAAGGMLLQSIGHAAPAAPAPVYQFFNAPEAAFIEVAVARLIPADALGPGALDAGVPNYLDLQLAGAWGVGERLYRAGPWQQGTSSQGYQLPFTPAELFRNALRADPSGQMTAIAKALDDTDIEALAAYFASRPTPPTAAAAVPSGPDAPQAPAQGTGSEQGLPVTGAGQDGAPQNSSAPTSAGQRDER